MIVDVHAHIFPRICGMTASGPTVGIGYGRISVGGTPHQLMPPLNEQTIHTPEMLIAQMDWAGVDKALLLQGPDHGVCNEYVAKALARYPDCLIGAGTFDPWSQNSRQTFEREVLGAGFRCLKLEISNGTGSVRGASRRITGFTGPGLDMEVPRLYPK